MHRNLLLYSISTNSWEQRKLGDICQVTMGQSPDGTTYSELPLGYILVQGNADLNNGWVCPRTWTTQKTKTAEEGDLILSVRAPAGAVGKTSYNVVIGRGVAGIKGNEFIYQSLIKMDLGGYWRTIAAGSTFESINSDAVNNAKLMVPQDIEEQNIVGGYLYLFDKLITLHQRKLERLKNVKKSMLDKMFPKDGEVVPEIRFKGFTDAWEQRKLGEIGKCQSGIGFPDAEQGGKNGTPFYKVSDMNNSGNEQEMTYANNYVTDEQIIRKNWKPIMEVPAVIFAKVGAAIMLNRKRLCRFSFLLDNNTMAYKFGEKWDTNFGKTIFEKIDLTELIQIGALPSYNTTDVENIDIKMPTDMNEQRVLGQYFASLDNLITLHQRKLDKLKNIKKSMLDNMFV